MNYIFPILAIIFWAGNTIITKLSSTVLHPFEIGFYRWLVATLILTPFVLMGIIKNINELKRQLPKLMILGFLGGVIYQTLSYYSAHYTSATNMAIIQAFIPIITLLLSKLFLDHNVSKISSIGIGASAFGVIIVVSNGDLMSLISGGVNIGDILILIGSIGFALYGFFVQKWRLKINLIHSVYIQAIFATIMLLPFYLMTNKNTLSIDSIFYISFAGIVASILAPLVWMMSLNKIGAARSTIFFNLLPVVTALFAFVLLSEQLSNTTLIGGIIIIVGVVVAEKFKDVKKLSSP